jgi:triose/dihydroxyacetone kinase / FAD-AMP lyase (cyclizing)
VAADPKIVDPLVFKNTLFGGLKRLIVAEPSVTRFDTIVGDGDCGVVLKRGAEAILTLLEQKEPVEDVVIAVSRIVGVIENTMDGTSGAIYSIFLNSLIHGLRQQDNDSPCPVITETWVTALAYSLDALGKYTPAKVGDRTLIDALLPFCTKLAETRDIQAATKAAQEGAEATKHMKPSLGRTVYVGGEETWLGKIPDPGAYGLSEFLAGLAGAI